MYKHLLSDLDIEKRSFSAIHVNAKMDMKEIHMQVAQVFFWHHNYHPYLCPIYPFLLQTDIDECAEVSLHPQCKTKSVCVNLIGTYGCVCINGYEGTHYGN